MGETEKQDDICNIQIINPQLADDQETTTKLSLDSIRDQEETKTPFFKPRFRSRRSRDTCVIFLFVIIHSIFFLTTMIVNDCGRNSHGDCAINALGRVSFQPLSENPFLGPSASTLDKMGAIRQTFLAKHQIWRLFSCPWLHAGAFHFTVNIVGITIIGIYLEKEFGPVRIGIIYITSAFLGTLVTALFVRDVPAVSSSGALLGLIGATVSALTRNWKVYTNKAAALLTLFFVAAFTFALGLLPYMDNYANIGGLLSGFLLGLALFFTPQVRQVTPGKLGLYEYGGRSSFNWKQKLDRPVLRTISSFLFCLLLAGLLVSVLLGINIGRHCSWCGYVDCIPSKMWSCNDMTTSCETMVSDTELTLTCMGSGNFRIFPFTNISHERTQDLCTLICSSHMRPFLP